MRNSLGNCPRRLNVFPASCSQEMAFEEWDDMLRFIAYDHLVRSTNVAVSPSVLAMVGVASG